MLQIEQEKGKHAGREPQGQLVSQGLEGCFDAEHARCQPGARGQNDARPKRSEQRSDPGETRLTSCGAIGGFDGLLLLWMGGACLPASPEGVRSSSDTEDTRITYWLDLSTLPVRRSIRLLVRAKGVTPVFTRGAGLSSSSGERQVALACERRACRQLPGN